MNPQTQPAPDDFPQLAPESLTTGFTCPHRYACWQREAIRLVLTAVVAGVVALFAHGCTAGQGGTLSDFSLTTPLGSMTLKAGSVSPAVPAPTSRPVPLP